MTQPLPTSGSTNWYPWASQVDAQARSAMQSTDIGSGNANDVALRAAYVAGRACTTDGTNSLPSPTGVGLEFVITTTSGTVGLQDIRFNGASL